MNFNLHDLILPLPEDFLLGMICLILLVDVFLKPAQRRSLLAVDRRIAGYDRAGSCQARAGRDRIRRHVRP